MAVPEKQLINSCTTVVRALIIFHAKGPFIQQMNYPITQTISVYIYIYIVVNNEDKSESIKKIEKQSNPKAINLL